VNGACAAGVLVDANVGTRPSAELIRGVMAVDPRSSKARATFVRKAEAAFAKARQSSADALKAYIERVEKTKLPSAKALMRERDKLR